MGPKLNRLRGVRREPRNIRQLDDRDRVLPSKFPRLGGPATFRQQQQQRLPTNVLPIIPYRFSPFPRHNYRDQFLHFPLLPPGSIPNSESVIYLTTV